MVEDLFNTPNFFHVYGKRTAEGRLTIAKINYEHAGMKHVNHSRLLTLQDENVLKIHKPSKHAFLDFVYRLFQRLAKEKSRSGKEIAPTALSVRTRRQWTENRTRVQRS